MNEALCYTYLDVEYELLSRRMTWPPSWQFVSVYPDEIVVVCNDENQCREESYRFLTSVPGLCWIDEEQAIALRTGQRVYVSYEHMEASESVSSSDARPPLFRNVIYQETEQPRQISKERKLDVPVVAFHSYKGGVGRTLAALSLLRANETKKVLLVDADIEAPGLTWMAERDSQKNWRPQISYWDVLGIIHTTEDAALYGEVLDNIIHFFEVSTINIPVDDVFTEHFFLPAYRYREQLSLASPNPNDIVSMPKRAFIITDFLSRIAFQLKADVVIVDLRAGLTDLSAPLLFDSRVRKVFVTSTSYQSRMGTKLLLDYVNKAQRIDFATERDVATPTILLTMIPKGMDEKTFDVIKADLTQAALPISPTIVDFSEDDNMASALLSDIVLPVSFTEQLLHLEGLEHTCERLTETNLEQVSKELRKRLTIDADLSKESPEERSQTIEKIHQAANEVLTAEGTGSAQGVLVTAPLERLIKDYRNKLPKLVIEGAKGSGKTYLYRQLLRNMFWERFVASVSESGEDKHKDDIVIMPLLSSINRSIMRDDLKKCIESTGKILAMNILPDIIDRNETKISREIDNAPDQLKWVEIWTELICGTLLPGSNSSSLEEIDEKLSQTGKKILLIVDGLDDLFVDALSGDAGKANASKTAIRALCQDIINKMSYYSNIGLLVFVRKDMTKSAITTNYEQFMAQYNSYSLTWSQDEALRLVIWTLAGVDWGK